MDWSFFFEVLIGGLLAGIMYSLVALGFVLIYKASGVFNFAQGAMVFFAALIFVSLFEKGWGLAGAAAATLGVMVVLAFFAQLWSGVDASTVEYGYWELTLAGTDVERT